MTVKMIAAQSGQGQLELMDLNGHIVYQQKVNIYEGSNQFDLFFKNRTMSSGFYVLRLETTGKSGMPNVYRTKVLLK